MNAQGGCREGEEVGLDLGSVSAGPRGLVTINQKKNAGAYEDKDCHRLPQCTELWWRFARVGSAGVERVFRESPVSPPIPTVKTTARSPLLHRIGAD